MKGFLWFLGCFLMLGQLGTALATPLEDLIAAAKKEGVHRVARAFDNGTKGNPGAGGRFQQEIWPQHQDKLQPFFQYDRRRSEGRHGRRVPGNSTHESSRGGLTIKAVIATTF